MTTRIAAAAIVFPLALASLGALSAASRAVTAEASAVATLEQGAAPQELHWAQRLALRVAARERATAIVEQVVLVPDGATYLDEIGRWTLERRWPVLIEDDHLAPKFIRAFAPRRVIRRDSVGDALPKGDALRAAIAATTLRTLGGSPPAGADSAAIEVALDAHLGTMGDPPPGVVLVVPGDSAWTAALALSAGRALPIRWLPGRFGRPTDTLRMERLQELEREVVTLLDGTPWPWRALGDPIETICVCGDLAVRAMHDQRRAVGGNPDSVAVATTDMLGRLPDASRGAFAGWIFGSDVRAAYVAMSSLFLPRTDVLLFNGYGDTAPWSNYELVSPQRMLSEAGFETALRTGEGASADSWQSTLLGGWSHDVAFVNSSGNVDFFNVAGSARRNAADAPVLNHPLAVHFVHSWSFRFPTDMGTVGARFLEHGAYAFAGSVEEPGLGAFLPPRIIVPRLKGGVPFLIALRWWPNEAMARPWRVATYGDPLMTMPPPAEDPRKRVAPADDGVEDLRAVAQRLMTEANEQRAPEPLNKAIRILALLGEDRIAVELHRAGVAGGFADATSALAALVPYFVTGDYNGFIAAWDASGPQGFPYQDMAWHLLWPRLVPGERRIALILESTMRAPRPDLDALRLHRKLIEISGREEARAFLQRAIDRMPNETRAKRLREELNRR